MFLILVININYNDPNVIDRKQVNVWRKFYGVSHKLPSNIHVQPIDL
jgi:hypothetical protein